MITGKPVTVAEIEATLGKEIYMYRLSTYMWHIKTKADGVVKAIKDGRKVKAYQLVNFDQFDSNGRFKGNQQLQTKATPVKPVVVQQSVTA